MALFFGLEPGVERAVPGLRVKIQDDGERVYMAGKWLDLGPDHAVAWIEGKYRFITVKGKSLLLGEFPAWVCTSKSKKQAAIMFSASQFLGGTIEV